MNALLGLFLREFILFAPTRDLLSRQFELAASFAGREGDAAEAGGFEVGDCGRVFLADEGMVGVREVRADLLAGAVRGDLVVVVTVNPY